MEFDLMAGGGTWSECADLAQRIEQHGFSGMLFTETAEVPWMKIAAAATAAPSLQFSTGIAVAFPRSPMITASTAWELAANTAGRFRLGLGSQVKGHVVRRYSAEFAPAAPRLREYVEAVQACWRAFRREEALSYDGEFYRLNYLPAAWSPPRHDHEDLRVDISAVGPVMTRIAGEVADGVHVHPLHSPTYLEHRLRPAVADGARRRDRSADDIDLVVPVFAAPGDTPEERAPLVQRARTQIAFYGSTPNYSFQFDDLGFTGTTERLGALVRAGDTTAMAATITDEMLDHFAVVCRWDELADRLIDRYAGIASRLVMYLADDSIRRDPTTLPRWGEVARAVRAASTPT